MDTEKINKECSNVFLIDEELCLSDSLNIVNTNFNNLSTQLVNIENYYNKIIDFYTIFQTNSSNYFNSLTYLNNFSAKWDSAFDTVMKYKNSWDSSPIFLLYPNLIEFDNWYLYRNATLDNIVHWLEINLPTVDYAENQIVRLSLNLTKVQNFEFNFKKSYDEKCAIYGSNSKKCEKCNNASIKSCCASNESCISKTKLEYFDTIKISNFASDTIKSSPFDLNFLNSNFNIKYGAILKKGFVIDGEGKIGNTTVKDVTLDSDLDIPTEIDRVNKYLYLNYDIYSTFNRTTEQKVSVKKEISPNRSSVLTGTYSVGPSLKQIEINIFNSNPVSFGNFPAGKYRIIYVKGAFSYWSGGERWLAIPPTLKILKTPSSIAISGITNDYYLDSVAAVSQATNYNNTGNPWYIEFDHSGGDISLQFTDDPYHDNRELNGTAPVFNLVSMVPNKIETGPNDGTYEMITVTNPYNVSADFTFKGLVDNELYLNDSSVSDFFETKTLVEKKLSNIPANGTVKISVYSSQKSNIAADFAEIDGTVTWYALSNPSSNVGFKGNIEWYAKCVPEIAPIIIENCDACKNCDVLPDDKYITVECGKLSGDKTLNINYTKGISDRSIYRTLYVSFRKNNNNWILTA